MNFVGKGQPLTRAGLNKVLAALGLGPTDAAYIWTVAEVETALGELKPEKKQPPEAPSKATE